MIRILFAVLVCMLVASPVATADDKLAPRASDDPLTATAKAFVARVAWHARQKDASDKAMVLSDKGGVEFGRVTLRSLLVVGDDNRARVANDVGMMLRWSDTVYRQFRADGGNITLGAKASATLWRTIERNLGQMAADEGNTATGMVYRHARGLAQGAAAFSSWAERNGQSVLSAAAWIGDNTVDAGKTLYALFADL